MPFGKEPFTGSLFGAEKFKGKGGKPPLIPIEEISKVTPEPSEDLSQEVKGETVDEGAERWQTNREGARAILDKMDSLDQKGTEKSNP